MAERKFGEEEVAALFERAAELQAQRDAAHGRAGEMQGLTLDELTAIAADAGLDPELLRRAAAEMARPGKRARASRVVGGEIHAERWVAGRLDDVVKEDIVSELRHRFDRSSAWHGGTMTGYGKSVVQTVGRNLEWHHVDPWWGTERRILIQPRGDEVRIRVTQKNVYTGGATAWSSLYGFFAAIAAAFVAGPVTGSLLFALVVGLVIFALSTPLLTNAARRAEETQRDEVEDLAEMIAQHIGAEQTVGAPELEREIPGLELEEDPEPVRRQRARGRSG